MLQQQADDGLRQHDVAERGRQDDERRRADSPGQELAKLPGPALRPVRRQRREQRRHDRHREDGVGKLEERERRDVGRVPGVSRGEHDDLEQPELVHQHVHEHPRGEPCDAPDRLRSPVRSPSPAEPQPAQRRPQRGRHGEHTERRADREDIPLRRGHAVHRRMRRSRHRGEDRHRGDHDEVVQDRREHRHGEPPVRVQQARRHRADSVEQDLRHEPPQEERGELAFALEVPRPHVDRVELHDPRRCHDREHHDRAEDHHGERQHAAPDVPRGFSAVAPEPLHEHGNEHRREHAAQDQLVDDVGGVVRDVVRVRPNRDDAERGRHRGEAQESGEPRQGRADRHDGRGAAEPARLDDRELLSLQGPFGLV